MVTIFWIAILATYTKCLGYKWCISFKLNIFNLKIFSGQMINYFYCVNLIEIKIL